MVFPKRCRKATAGACSSSAAAIANAAFSKDVTLNVAMTDRLFWHAQIVQGVEESDRPCMEAEKDRTFQDRCRSAGRYFYASVKKETNETLVERFRKP